MTLRTQEKFRNRETFHNVLFKMYFRQILFNVFDQNVATTLPKQERFFFKFF